MSELTEETSEFITLIKNNEKLSNIQCYYEINKDNIDISADDDYIFRNACKKNNMELIKFLYPLKTWRMKVPQEEEFIVKFENVFSFCCTHGYLEIAQWLLETYPIYNSDVTDIFSCVCMDGHLKVAKWLLEINSDIDISDDDEWDFRWACELGHLEIAKWLLEVKPDINISILDEYAFRLSLSKWTFRNSSMVIRSKT